VITSASQRWFWPPSFEPIAPSQWESGNLDSFSGGGGRGGAGSQSENCADGGNRPVGSLDSKMEQLGSLLREDGGSTVPLQLSEMKGSRNTDKGSISATLRAMFPKAKIRTYKPEVEEREPPAPLPALKMHTNVNKKQEVDGHRWANRPLKIVPDRRQQAGKNRSASLGLQSDSRRRSWEEEHKAELAEAQGSKNRSPSPVLQSDSRSSWKRSWGEQRSEDLDELVEAQGGKNCTPSPVMPSDSRKLEKNGPGGIDDTGSRREQQKDEEEDVIASSTESDVPQSPRRSGGSASSGPVLEDGVLERTTSVQSQGPRPTGVKENWADIESGNEDDFILPADTKSNSGDKAGQPEDEAITEVATAREGHWTEERVACAANRGFELRKRSDHWDLRIDMGGLEPPFTEVGMERYCDWLKKRLQAFRDDEGDEPLRRCRGKVDFSHNRLNNQMVWLLLETLAQYEVHTALRNFLRTSSRRRESLQFASSSV